MNDPIGVALADWYDRGHRDLPWRHTHDPYAIWVSEVMLQQTQVNTVLGYYARFMDRFPSTAALAAADLDEVYALWQGLGYYRRAANLHRGAVYIEDVLHGVFPTDVEGLRQVPGIGAYTAGAIASFAYGIAAPAVDGNVTRVITRLDAIEDPVDKAATKQQLEARAQALIPEGRAYALNQALMELGALVCTPRQPDCEHCPVGNLCEAWAQDRVDQFPVKPPSKKQKVVSRTVYLIRTVDAVLLRRRPDEGLLSGLWEFPGFEAGEEDPLAALGLQDVPRVDIGQGRHVFSHRIWQMQGYRLDLKEAIPVSDPYRWVALAELSAVAIPTAFRFIRTQL